MFKTVGHQTLEFRNNTDDVEKNGPFPVENVSTSFLGSGYYFWDNHIELAHWWGDWRIKKQYIIGECEIGVERNDFFDLVGSRDDQINLQNIIDKLNLKDLSIGEIIEVLKGMEKNVTGIFPYKAIRAVDNSIKLSFSQEKYLFQSDKASFSILSPMYMICLLDKKELLLSPFKVIFT